MRNENKNFSKFFEKWEIFQNEKNWIKRKWNNWEIFLNHHGHNNLIL